jgi:hypothetical protein
LTIPDAIKLLRETNTELKEKEEKTRIHLILSHPCIEYWFILHYKKTASGFNKNDHTIRELNKPLKSHHFKYSKEEETVKNFCDLIYDKTDIAVKNAKNLRKNHPWGSSLTAHNPSTDVDKVVKKLIAISKM